MMVKKKYGLDVVIPKPDTKAGPGINAWEAELDKNVPPLAAFNAADHKEG